MPSTFQLITLGLGALGFLGTWLLGAFYLGRTVEQMQAAVKKYIDDEQDKIVHKIDALEEKFLTDQRTQDHNFGEVGAAMRQYTADVEKKVREIEIFGRDHYVQKDDFKDAIDKLGNQIERGNSEIKADLKELQKQIVQRN